MEGIVIKASGGVYEVQIGDQCYTCSLRHHIIETEKRRLNQTKEMPYVDLVAVGDCVHISPSTSTVNAGYIEECLPRQTQFGRPRMDGWRQIIVANLEMLLIIFAARHPTLKLRMLDRFLVTAEASDIEPVICINKMDLAKLENVQRELNLYEELGYKVVYTSIVTAGLFSFRHFSRFFSQTLIFWICRNSVRNHAISAGLHLKNSTFEVKNARERFSTLVR